MYKLSHIQIKVEKIERGISDFEKMGFMVERGGKKSRNAFIWFEEGPFLELLEMHRKDIIFGPLFGLLYGKAMYGRWLKWCSRGEGIIDFAMEPSDADRLLIHNFKKVREEARKMDLKPGKVITWSRKNIKGKKICFSYLPVLPKSLPFLVSDYDIPQRPKRIVHANGAAKVVKLNVTCGSREYEAFKKLTKYDPSIQLRKGSKFRIHSLGISGITKDLPENLLHNAIIETGNCETI